MSLAPLLFAFSACAPVEGHLQASAEKVVYDAAAGSSVVRYCESETRTRGFDVGCPIVDLELVGDRLFVACRGVWVVEYEQAGRADSMPVRMGTYAHDREVLGLEQRDGQLSIEFGDALSAEAAGTPPSNPDRTPEAPMPGAARWAAQRQAIRMQAGGGALVGVGGLLGLTAGALGLWDSPYTTGSVTVGIVIPVVLIAAGTPLVVVGTKRLKRTRNPSQVWLHNGRTRWGTRTYGLRLRF